MTSTAPVTAPAQDIPSGDDELWYTRCPVPTAFEVAQARGLFDAELEGSGLRWIPLATSDDPAVHRSHFTHRKAASFRHGGNVPAIAARAAGADTRVIGVSWLPTAYTVVVGPGSDIRTPADLRGRRLLVPRRPEADVDFWAASTLRVYERALGSASLTLDDVELVETRADEDLIPAAGHAAPADRLRWTLHNAYAIQRAVLVPLVRGDVDAVTSQASLSAQLVGLVGGRVVYDQAAQTGLDRVNNGAPDVVTVSGRLLEEHPDRVARVLARILEGAAWAAAHPAAAFDLIADRIQISSALLEATYGRGIGGSLEVGLPGDTAAVLTDQHDFLLRHGFIDRAFDVAGWIDPRPLQAARRLLADRAAAAGAGA